MAKFNTNYININFLKAKINLHYARIRVVPQREHGVLRLERRGNNSRLSRSRITPSEKKKTESF